MPLLTLPLGECIFLSVTAFTSLLAAGTSVATHESGYFQIFTVPFFSGLAAFCLSLMAFSLYHEPPIQRLEIELGTLTTPGPGLSPAPYTAYPPNHYGVDCSVNDLVQHMQVIKGRAEELQGQKERERRVAARKKFNRASRLIGGRFSRRFFEHETEEERGIRRQWAGRQVDF